MEWKLWIWPSLTVVGLSKSFGAGDECQAFLKKMRANLVISGRQERTMHMGTQPQDQTCKPDHKWYRSTKLIKFVTSFSPFIPGVTHFTLYNDTMSPQVSCLLRYYQDLGIVQVLPWNLSMESQAEIRTEGLFAALNDCLYRNMNRFR